MTKNEEKMQDRLVEILQDKGFQTWTFEEDYIATNEAGLTIKKDGKSYQITIVECRQFQ